MVFLIFHFQQVLTGSLKTFEKIPTKKAPRTLNCSLTLQLQLTMNLCLLMIRFRLMGLSAKLFESTWRYLHSHSIKTK